jgi:integrase
MSGGSGGSVSSMDQGIRPRRPPRKLRSQGKAERLQQALDAGVDLVTVSRLLGHMSLNSTARYTTPSAQDLEQAVEKLEADYIDPTRAERR